MGDTEKLRRRMEELGADKDEEGLFLLRGRATAGLGGQEVVLDDGVEYRKDLTWHRIVPRLPAGLGVKVKVI